MPHWVRNAAMLLGVLALIPLACAVRARSVRSNVPRLHVIQDMDNQGRYKSQMANALFADGRAMRPPVDGTVARGQLRTDRHLYAGIVGQDYANNFPVPVTGSLVDRGRERYQIFCSPCHGLAGYGDGMVALRADELQQGTWVPPSSFHEAPAHGRSVGHLFNTITHGIRNMPAYGSQVGVEDRWAIVAYVVALQRSQHAALDDLPPAERAKLEQDPQRTRRR